MYISSIDTPHHEVLDTCMLAEVFHPARIGPDITARYSIAHAKVAVGRATLPHTLLTSSEVYIILQGTGRMHINDESEDVHAGQVIYIPPGSVQYIENTGTDELRFLAIVDPMWDENDDILGSPHTQ